VTRRHLLVLGTSAVYALALAAIAFWPTHVDRNVDVLDLPAARWVRELGLSPRAVYAVIEFSANITLFVPLGVLAMLLSARVTWRRAVLVGLVVSGGIEVVQAVARPERTANVSDVVANVVGAALGTGVVMWWRGRSSR
jgi:glycopeptide antibiotics resistance protein